MVYGIILDVATSSGGKMNKQKMLPKKIYLHSPNDRYGRTVWCEDRHADDDTEYIRMDVVRELLEFFDCDICSSAKVCGHDGEYSCTESIIKYILNRD